MEVKVSCKRFEELTAQELYENLRLRSEVFVVEQNCVFLDMDNKDQHCHHLLMYHGSDLVASSRLVPAGVCYAEMSIGRVVTHTSVRGTGIGKQLMQTSIDQMYQLFGHGPIKIGAQLYAKVFYERLGFVQQGAVYDEDGIDHIHMIKA